MAADWIECTLGDVIELKRGYDLPRGARKPGVVPLVSSSGVSDHQGEVMVRGPGVVTGRYGTLGQVFFIEQDFWPLNTTLYVHDFKGNDPRFISYFLRSLDLGGYSDKAAVPGVNRNHLHREPVRVPSSKAEQRRIANILGTLDDKIELNRHMNETLEEMARALFTSWFVDFDPVRAKAEGRDPGLPPHLADLFPDRLIECELEQIPEGWRMTELSNLATVASGGTPKTSVGEYWDGAIPWFSVVDAPAVSDVWVTDTEKHVTEAGVASSAAEVVPTRSTILSARGTVGKVALAGTPMAFNQSCYGFVPHPGVAGYHTYFAVRALVAALQQRAHGSVFDTITKATLAGVSVPRPPARLIRAYESAVGDVMQRIRANRLESKALQWVRDSLLPRLVAGTIRTEDRGAVPEP